MKLRIVALGDSLTQGYPFGKDCSWVNILAREQGWDILNKGLKGQTTCEIQGRFSQDVLSAKAQIVVITGGANDVYQRIPVTTILNNYRHMIELAMKHGILPIIGLTSPMYMPDLEEQLKTLRAELRQLAVQQKLASIDFYDALTDRLTGQIAKKWDHDGVHPNPDGYRRMAEAAEPVLRNILEQLAEGTSNIRLGLYRHYKGKMYQVIGVAKHSETLEELVVYRALYGEKGLWVRPIGMFLEMLEFNGEQIQRFEFAGEAE